MTKKIREINGYIHYYVEEYSLPMLLGMFAALVFANINHGAYQKILEVLHLEFFANSFVIAFLFALAAKEIKEALTLPGGALNSFEKAMNPCIATIGGVVGPAIITILLVKFFYGDNPGLTKLWTVPTATDMALSLFVAKRVFGKVSHPAVVFLLMLAVLDDASGLIIMATVLRDPSHPVQPVWLLLVVGAVYLGILLRRSRVSEWVHYVFGPGVLSWAGMHYSGLHPSLALVPIVLFCMPAGKRDAGIGAEASEKMRGYSQYSSTLESMEHSIKIPLEYGLAFFAFANAGVPFTSVNMVTWIVLGALVFGKTLVIFLFASVASIRYPLPSGMSKRDLFAMSYIASIGFTISLFMATQAVPLGPLANGAKMGAVLSGVTMIVGPFLGRKIRGVKSEKAEQIAA